MHAKYVVSDGDVDDGVQENLFYQNYSKNRNKVFLF